MLGNGASNVRNASTQRVSGENHVLAGNGHHVSNQLTVVAVVRLKPEQKHLQGDEQNRNEKHTA